MNDQYIKNQLQDIFRDIFDEDRLLINNSTNAEDIENYFCAEDKEAYKLCKQIDDLDS